jgi:hypothetical protein
MFRFIKKPLQPCFVLILLFLSISCTQNSEELNQSKQKYPKVSLFSTETRILHSEIIEENLNCTYLCLMNTQ